MIKQRPTENFDVVYLYDPALDMVQDSIVEQYHKSGRDISVLGDLSSLADQPSVFTCRPLDVKHEHLIDLMQVQASSAGWQIFKHHVIAAQNLTDDNGRPILKFTDGINPEIKDECRELIPKAVVNDIVSVIILRATEIGLGFTLPAQYWAMRAQSKVRHATAALQKGLTAAK